MNVNNLRLFLQSLVKPLSGSGVPHQTITDLDRMGRALDRFADRPVGEFALFIERAEEYERQGHWPESKPSIRGEVVDQPSPEEYAERLKAFLRREVPATGPMPEAVVTELDALKAGMKVDQLKELAAACGVAGRVTSAGAAIEKTFERLTGRKLPESLIECYADLLQQSVSDGADLEQILVKVQGALGVPQIKKLAIRLGVKDKVTGKPDGIAKIRAFLSNGAGHPVRQETSPEEPKAADDSQPRSEERVNRTVEILKALKAKADPDDAAHQEIEDELTRLEQELSKEDAVVAAKELGVGFGVHSKSDAMRRIREKVFERKLVREKIRY